MFKTATLVYKFLHTNFPKFFAPYISSYSGSYSTSCSQSGGNFLVIPKFQPSVHKSVKNRLVIVLFLLLILPLFGMLFLMRFVGPPLLPPSENGSKPTLHHGIPSLVLLIPGILCGAWTLFCPWILKLVDCFFVSLRLRVPFNRGD